MLKIVLAWLGKLWKIVFGYIDVRAPRMAEPENVSCKLTEQLRLSIPSNFKKQCWRGLASSEKLYLVTSISVLPGMRTRKTRSRRLTVQIRYPLPSAMLWICYSWWPMSESLKWAHRCSSLVVENSFHRIPLNHSSQPSKPSADNEIHKRCN